MKPRSKPPQTVKTIAVLWDNGPLRGTVAVVNGSLRGLKAPSGRASGNAFEFPPGGAPKLLVSVAGLHPRRGPGRVRVEVREETRPFAFFLADVSQAAPLFIPALRSAVTAAGDTRSFKALARAVRNNRLLSEIQSIDSEPEESFETACAATRDLMCPTWLGLGRDMRIFEFGYRPELGYWGYVQPRYHSVKPSLPETGGLPYSIDFAVGPGSSCSVDIDRSLEEDSLPILRSVQHERNVDYSLTAFVSREKTPLDSGRVRGTPWQAAYPNTGGNQLSPAELEAFNKSALAHREMHARKEELVLCIRVQATNLRRTPAYAWFRGAGIRGLQRPAAFDPSSGSSLLSSKRVFAVHRLDGLPLHELETAVLLQPRETAVFELLIPHRPLSRARARRLTAFDFDRHLDACRSFWHAKLDSAATLSLPEKPVHDRVRAGLLHLDINTIGSEPRGSLMACVGAYSPIGSESAPMILFYDSLGLHDVASRCIRFFLDRQRKDGFIQNFGGYQLETGPLLWCIGEHYRYTHDDAWARSVKPKALKACRYLLDWRARNLRDDLRGRGYGLLDGKVADPDDFFHSFMLNALSYLGISRIAEMLSSIAPSESARLAAEASSFRTDIRSAYAQAVARSPVIPSGDGSWIPSAPPWTEYPGPVSLHADGGDWFTHGAAGARDSLIGALWLVFSEVLDPDEPLAEYLLAMHQELFTRRNAGLSQPYYCRHDYIHLARGEVKPFLKTYYNQMASLQDRRTYSFWEHYWFASQHKTHEEAWFLMQTRWMLWLEKGDTLALLEGVPRRWLRSGRTIGLDGVRSYFGSLSLAVESHLAKGVISAEFRCPGKHLPAAVTVRLPHPDGRKPLSVAGGSYDPASETVRVSPFAGKAKVFLRF
ncbi:MAG: hypothetical protein JW909_03110 [Planctomycetes bacterium]|nr:hypothetical protein [Planctomycetota bacterium]